eukprot:295593-Rhodomonas_salina.2
MFERSRLAVLCASTAQHELRPYGAGGGRERGGECGAGRKGTRKEEMMLTAACACWACRRRSASGSLRSEAWSRRLQWEARARPRTSINPSPEK